MTDLKENNTTKIILIIAAVVFFVEGIFLFFKPWAGIIGLSGVGLTISGIIAIGIAILIILSLDLFEIPISIKIPLSPFNVIILAIIAWVCSCIYGLLCLLIALALDAKNNAMN